MHLPRPASPRLEPVPKAAERAREAVERDEGAPGWPAAPASA